MADIMTSLLIWEYGLKPVVDSVKKEYGEVTKNLLKEGLAKVWQRVSLSLEDKALLEAEILEADVLVLRDKEKCLDYLNNNKTIQNIINQTTYSIVENNGVQHNEGPVTINNYPKH